MLRALAAFAFALLATATAAAQDQPRIAIPNFWDPRIRLDRPEPGPPRVVRFLTDDDYPPFHFAGPDGALTGFSVELARAVCDKLGWTCTIQPRRFDTFRETSGLNAAVAALRSGDAEYVFGDGPALALLISASGGELAFSGGPYLESRYFGEGVAFLLRKDDPALQRAIDYALQSLWDDGTYSRLYLRFFPVSPF
ncbi:transporter substrate-binding domain-containing protein [Bosea sp. TAB14]|uniref:transporter substrate-binding domain-containing protein n=1 Tax=Bosea sp. TAB14 TaxID=3237481 RepID=UPI003F90C0A8